MYIFNRGCDAVKTVSVRDARSHLKALLDRVAAGEEIVIGRRGKAAARLVPPVRKRRHPPDLTAFRATIRLKGEPVSVTVAKAREEERH